ncbi:MAG: hypothetical protein ACXVA3_11655 [Vulcanimicrobiaceae bacterium]
MRRLTLAAIFATIASLALAASTSPRADHPRPAVAVVHPPAARQAFTRPAPFARPAAEHPLQAHDASPAAAPAAPSATATPAVRRAPRKGFHFPAWFYRHRMAMQSALA